MGSSIEQVFASADGFGSDGISLLSKRLHQQIRLKYIGLSIEQVSASEM